MCKAKPAQNWRRTGVQLLSVSVMGCVEAEMSKKARPRSGTFVQGGWTGGEGISANPLKTGAHILSDAALTMKLRLTARHRRQPSLCGLRVVRRGDAERRLSGSLMGVAYACMNEGFDYDDVHL